MRHIIYSEFVATKLESFFSSKKHRRRIALAAVVLLGSNARWFLSSNARMDPEDLDDKKLSATGDLWVEILHGQSNRIDSKSQGSQDTYLETIFQKVGETNRFFVEFGFNEDNYTSGGSGANTWNLYDKGWRGLLLDGNRTNKVINLHNHYLFANNIGGILKQYMVPQHLDYLSCDMDSHDLFVFEAILRDGFRPRIVTTEYNANYPLGLAISQIDPTLSDDRVQGYNFEFKGCAWGASASALKIVADTYGYTLIGRVGILDLVWIRNDLIQLEWKIPRFEWFFDDGRLGSNDFLLHEPQESREIFNYLVDYSEYALHKNLENAKKAAEERIMTLNTQCFAALKRSVP